VVLPAETSRIERRRRLLGPAPRMVQELTCPRPLDVGRIPSTRPGHDHRTRHLAVPHQQRFVLDVIKHLPEQMEVVVDLHLRPYYDDEDETSGLYHSETKDGTTAFRAYATLYARVRSKRYTLAVRVSKTATPPVMSSPSSLAFSKALTARPRPSTSTASSTTGSVSRCCTPTTSHTSHRS